MDKTEAELLERWCADFDGSTDCRENLAKDGSDYHSLIEISLLYTSWAASRKYNRRDFIDRNIPNIGETAIVYTENGNILSDTYMEGYDGDYFETAEGFNERAARW